MRAKFDDLSEEQIKRFTEESGASAAVVAQVFKDKYAVYLPYSKYPGKAYILKAYITVNKRKQTLIVIFTRFKRHVAHIVRWRKYNQKTDQKYDFSKGRHPVEILESVVVAHLDPNMYQQAQSLADTMGTTVSGLVRKLLMEKIQEETNKKGE